MADVIIKVLDLDDCSWSGSEDPYSNGLFEWTALAAGVLEDEGLLAGLGACTAPLTQQVESLRLALDEQWTGGYTLQIAELEDLDDAERHAVIDAVVAGDESPYVVVNGRLVCTGGIDPTAVLGTRE